jgi:hypothetical protein
MRRADSFIPPITLLCGVILYLSVLPLATVERPRHEQLFTLPSNVLTIATPQFKEVAADLAFLNALTYLGGVQVQPKTNLYLPYQYEWLYNTLRNSVALDPYFVDPYYLMNSALIWDGYKVAEVNALIAKGADLRTWDSTLPFYVGFNYYYFLDDNSKSFTYLKEASKRAGGNAFYDSLASRVAYQGNKTEFAIAYLELQIDQAEHAGRGSSVEYLVRRLKLLKAIRQIEVAVEAYRKRYNKPPGSLSDLLSLKLLDAIPEEPNGGSFYLGADGKVYSSIDLKKTPRHIVRPGVSQ